LKVSALAESAAHALEVPKAPADPAFYAPWLEIAWRAFGPERLMYGSNCPVSNRAADYATVHGIVEAFVQDKGAAARRWFFFDTSRAAYRWA